MSMKKILMAVVAVSALTAGAASAASITSAKVSNITVYDVTAATPSSPYKIANETKFSTGLATTTTPTHNVTTAKVDGGPLGVGNYSVTFTLSGPAGFNSSVGNSALTNNSAGLCVVSPVVASGGGAAGTSVTYAVTVSGTCSTTVGNGDQGPQTFTLDAPLKVTGLGDVAVSASFAAGGVSIDNGAATARTLITNAAGFTVSAAADTTATQWLLTGGSAVYTTMSSDKNIGKYTVAPVTTGTTGPFVLATGASAAKVSDATQLPTADVVVSGDVSQLAVTVGGAGTTKNSGKTTSTLAGVASGTDILVAVVPGSPTASQGNTAFSMTVTPIAGSASYTAPAAVTAALQSVTLEGTNYLAPWVGGSQSSAATSIRLSNSGVATGAVTLQLGAPVYDAGTTAGATTCTSSTLSKLASIAGNTELVISNADLTTCFGAFKRGDVTITVQASSSSLTAKARNVNAGTGVVSEISLGAS